MPKNILVTGGAGGVGLRTCLTLAKNGNRVTALIAPWDEESRIAVLKQNGIETVVGDVCDLEPSRGAFMGKDAVVHTAAFLPENEDFLNKDAQWRVNVGGTENVIRMAHACAIPRAVFISSAGVASHYEKKTKAGDETFPYRDPQNAHVWSKIESEKMLDRVSAELSYPVIIIRPATIYGVGMRFRWPDVFSLTKKGAMKMVAGGNAPYPLINVEDLARAIALAIEVPPPGKTEKVIISSDEPITFRNIVTAVAEYFHAPKPMNLPYGVAMLASYVLCCIPAALKPQHLRHLTPGSVREYAYGHLYSTQKAKQFLGFTAAVPFERGMREMLDAYSGKKLL